MYKRQTLNYGMPNRRLPPPPHHHHHHHQHKHRHQWVHSFQGRISPLSIFAYWQRQPWPLLGAINTAAAGARVFLWASGAQFPGLHTALTRVSFSASTLNWLRRLGCGHPCKSLQSTSGERAEAGEAGNVKSTPKAPFLATSSSKRLLVDLGEH